MCGDQLLDDERALFERLPADGSTIGNGQLRRQLGWEEDRYFRIRDALEDKGCLKRWVGYGGTVRRADHESLATGTQVEAEEAPDVPVELVSPALKEAALYDDMRTVIAGNWAKANRMDPVAVEKTAHAGSKQTGAWSRPDIVSVEMRTFEYLPTKAVEITTFEVKTSDALDVRAVCEALSHRRSATRSYVVLHVPEEKAAALEPQIQEVALVNSVAWHRTHNGG